MALQKRCDLIKKEVPMLNVINTKLLVAIVVLLASIASYFAYEKHQQQVEQKKVDDAFQQMKAEGKQALPSRMAKSLKNK